MLKGKVDNGKSLVRNILAIRDAEFCKFVDLVQD